MQRYFLSTPFLEDGTHQLTGEDYKHIVKVMRMQEGEGIIVVADGQSYETEIQMITDDAVHVLKIGEMLASNELPIRVTIANGLAKGDKHDLIVQKATELGVERIVLFKAARSIVKWDDKKGHKKIERLQKIAHQAAEQCHRTVIPTVENPLTVKELIALGATYDVCYYADEEAAKQSERPRLQQHLSTLRAQDRVLVVFGPEGGIAREEAVLFQEAGFHPIALGPRILRTETAPLYFLSAISYVAE